MFFMQKEKSKNGSALIWVIGVSLFLGVGMVALYSYVPKIARMRSDSQKTLNTEIALNGIIDYTLNAIKGHWCMSDAWEAEPTCDFFKKYYFRRLMFEKDNGSAQSPLKQFQNILISTNDPAKDLSLEASGGDCANQGLRCTLMVFERTLNQIEADQSTLSDLLQPLRAGMRKTADKVHIEVNVQDVDDSDDTDSFRMKRYGLESYIKITARLEKSWEEDSEMEAVVAFFPRELNTYSLIIPGSLKLDGVVSPGSVDIKIDPVSKSSKANYKGLVFKSPVYMRDHLVLPAETSPFWAPVTFADLVYSGRGMVKSYDSSGGEVGYDPSSVGAPGSRFYSNSGSFGGLLKGFVRDTYDDVGLGYLFDPSVVSDTSYANLMARCIARKSLVAGTAPLSGRTLHVKKLASSPGALSLRLGLSDKNDFVSYEIPQVGQDGKTLTDPANGKNYAEDFAASSFSSVSSTSSTDASGVSHVSMTYEKVELKVDDTAGETNLNLKTNFDSSKGPIGELPGVIGEAKLRFGPNMELRFPVIRPTESGDTNGRVTLKLQKQQKTVNVATTTVSSSSSVSSPCAIGTSSSSSSSSNVSTTTTTIVDTSCVATTTEVTSTSTETLGTSTAASIRIEPKPVLVTGSEFYSGTSFVHPQLLDLQISTTGNLGSLANNLTVDVFPYGLRSRPELTAGGQLRKVTDETWKSTGGNPIQDFKIKISATTLLDAPEYSTGWETAAYDANPPSSPVSASLVDESKSPFELDQKCSNTTGAGVSSFGVANYKASFTTQTRHSWYFASVGGESWATFQSNSGVGNLQINGNEGATKDGFLIKSIARTCTVSPSARVVAGFLVCENFVIAPRSQELNFVGTLITKNISFGSGALASGVYFQSIFHPDGVALLRQVEILKGSSPAYDCDTRASDPTWNPNPNYTSLSNIFHCSSASLRKNADNFRWTSVDPDCGIVSGGTTTSCKGIKDRFLVKELYRRTNL